MTLFIKNAKILDIDKNKKLDVLISGNKISAIGNFYNKKADKIIDADGSYLSYGFVDVYNELDHNFKIFSKEFSSVIQDGLSNILIGHSGFSLVPIFDHDILNFKNYTSGYGINFNWQNFNQFNEFLHKNNFNFNIKTLIGFENIRYFILKNKNRQFNKKEFSYFLSILNENLEKDFLGLSLDWESVQFELLTIKQLEDITKIITNHSKILSITLPYDCNILEIIDFLIKLVSKNNVKILINNYLTNRITFEDNLNILKKLDNFYPNIFITVNPYQFSSFLIYKLLPLRIRKYYFTDILNILSDEWFLKRILDEIDDFNPEKFFIFQIDNNLKHHVLHNKRLREIMNDYEIDNPKLTILKIMANTKLRDVIFYNNINFDALIDSLISKNSLIGSGWIYLDNNKNVFLDFCNFILENHLMSIQDLIKKITTLPAKFLGLKNYENFQIGHQADLIGFDVLDKKIKIKFVIYNGKIVFLNNENQDINQKEVLHNSLLN